jgi:acetyl-CoA acetyltransferase
MTVELDLSARVAIAGIGTSRIGKVYGSSAGQFAVDAVVSAVADAGLTLSDVDGLLYSYGVSGGGSGRLQTLLGLRNLRTNVQLDCQGATAVIAVEHAAMLIATGACSTVVYVHADAPLTDPAASTGDSYGADLAARTPAGLMSLSPANGLAAAVPNYALATRRHMQRYGTTSEQLGAVAVSQRQWAVMNPLAQLRTPITLEDHQSSRLLCDPLRLLDTCLVSNGGVAFVITCAERARDLRRPAAYVWGWGEHHPGYPNAVGSDFGLRSGAVESGARAFAMAGVGVDDIDVRELYDCFTFTVLLTLEDYGFCAKGESGALAASGALGPGGELPTNTGGGQLSSFYLWACTPLLEAVTQLRGAAGTRQVPAHDLALVSGNGGVLDHHASLVLGAHPRA